jgi:hypothetical protein
MDGFKFSDVLRCFEVICKNKWIRVSHCLLRVWESYNNDDWGVVCCVRTCNPSKRLADSISMSAYMRAWSFRWTLVAATLFFSFLQIDFTYQLRFVEISVDYLLWLLISIMDMGGLSLACSAAKARLWEALSALWPSSIQMTSSYYESINVHSDIWKCLNGWDQKIDFGHKKMSVNSHMVKSPSWFSARCNFTDVGSEDFESINFTDVEL